MEQLLHLVFMFTAAANLVTEQFLCKCDKINIIANGMNSTAKVMNSTANGTKSIAKVTNSIAKTCRMIAHYFQLSTD